jgi:hypothetical protein
MFSYLDELFAGNVAGKSDLMLFSMYLFLNSHFECLLFIATKIRFVQRQAKAEIVWLVRRELRFVYSFLWLRIPSKMQWHSVDHRC